MAHGQGLAPERDSGERLSVEPERWQKVKELMLSAAELAPSDRSTFLNEACGSDESLRQSVDSLLVADQAAEDFLEEPAYRVFERPLPSRIGPYKVLRELGRGGMGTVYLAVRGDGDYGVRVALKVLEPRLAHGDFVRRFRAEGHVLARLRHPNIAALLDGGTSPEGLPYLVMEYVRGTPVDLYCRDRDLPLEQQLRLFQRVCSAVQFAHRSLVVHRDLKPSNILVTYDGVPKLLDFGIAKLLDPEPGPEPQAATATELRLMTPEYASPEQVRGEPVTTATDVYSLGHLLYVLLTRRGPYRLRSARLEELLRAICEQEPEKPSTALGNARTLRPQRKGQTTRRRLKRDLDHVILRALRKEPERRYRSVEELSGEVERHLAGLPVLARKGTLTYRTGRFLRRHTLGSLAGAAFAVTILSFAFTMAIQRREVARERDRAEQVTEFLIDMFEAANANNRPVNEPMTAREVLEEGAVALGAGLVDQPEQRAALMETVGRVYLSLGLGTQAESFLRDALTLRRAAGAHPLEVAVTVNHLAEALFRQGEFLDAEPLLRRALESQRESLDENHPAVARTLQNLARMHHEKGRYSTAEMLARRSLAIFRSAYGPRHEEVATGATGLAQALKRQGDLAQAERLFHEALALRRELLGRDHGEIVDALNNLASVLTDKGDHRRAEPLYREALGMARRLFGDEHPETAAMMNNLALAMIPRSDLAAAEELIREALKVNRKVLGAEHSVVAINLSNLASVLMTRGDYAGAEAMARESLNLRRQALGSEHPLIGQSLNVLASVLRWKGDLDAAEQLYRQALEKARRLGPASPHVVLILNRLTETALARGDLAAAEALGREASVIAERALDDAHPNRAVNLLRMAAVRIRRQDPVEAEHSIREALRLLSASYSADHWQVADARSLLGFCLARQQRFDEAEPLLLESYSLLRKTTSEKSPATMTAHQRLIDLYEAWDKTRKELRAHLQPQNMQRTK